MMYIVENSSVNTEAAARSMVYGSDLSISVIHGEQVTKLRKCSESRPLFKWDGQVHLNSDDSILVRVNDWKYLWLCPTLNEEMYG